MESSLWRAPPAGEFDLELSSTEDEEIGKTQSTELDSPDVEEISSSDSEVEIVAVKMAPKLLNPSQELLRMKDEERLGFLYRIQDRQAHWEAKLKRVRQELSNESSEARQVRRKSFQKAVLKMEP